MDETGLESWIRRWGERGVYKSSRGAGVQPLVGEGQQPHDPVLGGRGGHHHHDIEYHDYGANDHYDDNIVYDNHHSYIDYDHGTAHHHHGPNDNDILIHDHQYTEYDHQHIVADHYYDFTTIDYDYGSADHDHQHDAADPAEDGSEPRCLVCGRFRPTAVRPLGSDGTCNCQERFLGLTDR